MGNLGRSSTPTGTTARQKAKRTRSTSTTAARPAAPSSVPASTLNAIGQARVTLSRRHERSRAVCQPRQEETGPEIHPKHDSRRPERGRAVQCHFQPGVLEEVHAVSEPSATPLAAAAAAAALAAVALALALALTRTARSPRALPPRLGQGLRGMHRAGRRPLQRHATVQMVQPIVRAPEQAGRRHERLPACQLVDQT